jgi:hypothetical protein
MISTMLSGTAGISLQESRRPPPGAVARERSSDWVTADPDTLKCASPAARQSQAQAARLLTGQPTASIQDGRFSGAKRGVMLIGGAAAEFGVGGDGQLALGAGSGVPVGSVGHSGGEDGFALPVGPVQGLVGGRELLLASGAVVGAALASGAVVGAALAGGDGFGGGAQPG